MTDAEKHLLDLCSRARHEAGDVKDCFTRFSFQALGLSAVILGVIARYQAEQSSIGLASALVVILVLAVARIGNYKYATANRNFGFQLHVERTSRITPSKGGWQQNMRYVGWEEAMRAWRIVQATVFARIYETKGFRYNRLRADAPGEDRTRWWEPEKLMVDDTRYHSGSYLKTMQTVLHLVALLALVPIFSGAVQYGSEDPWRAGGMLSVALVSLGVTVWRILRNIARRELLESGLLSIHSCAIMWQAVLLAHHRAVERLHSAGRGYSGYTRALSEEALDVAENAGRLHEWLATPGDLKELTSV